MQENDVIKQVIDTIRRDVMSSPDFLKTILSNIELKEENVPTELIISLMNKLNATQQAPKAKVNAPLTISKEGGRALAKPVAIASGSVEAQIVSDLLEGNNVYLMGKAGTGKTYLAEAIANSVMGQEVYMINCSQWTSPVEIRGGQTIKGYEEGTLVKAWANGGILILDELPKLDPNTAGLLNQALAESAAQPKYDEDWNVIESTIPYITNGKGEKVYKGEGFPKGKVVPEDLKFRFCVIGTGNTDMMNVGGNKYSGNQRQDYSLVDRFAGSFYTIEADPIKEKILTYPYVFEVCNAMREFFKVNTDAIQSISLRTMLNFNRTFEQQMLYKEQSPFADEIKDNYGAPVPPKTIEDSISSFLSMLETNMQLAMRDFPAFKAATTSEKMVMAEANFRKQFEMKYHLNIMTREPLTEEEIMALGK